jgi:tetratricopeptide (TPR) repeat protein
MCGIAATLGDSDMLARSWIRLGQVQDSLKQYPDSLESATHAEEFSTKYDNTHAFALYAKAWALFRLQKFDEALPVALAASELSTRLENLDIKARSQNTVGAIYKFMGQYGLSEQHQQLALELFQQLGDRRRVAGMFNNLGETARLRQDFVSARALYQQAIKIAKEIGEKDWLVEFLNNLGSAQRQLGQTRDAERSFSQAAEVAKAAGIPEDAK